ncbi:hypothetical protein [Longimicrobium sp.]|uniref:hypothetical protein n=1 Tax=Longimicrobium sp. TaxID=2029185 RepID=UPI002BADF844|nr:hypothetical protein [Longimicrobium sp.]HSU15433.1 hypothetical protein [Longimicrobium sp.]
MKFAVPALAVLFSACSVNAALRVTPESVAQSVQTKYDPYKDETTVVAPGLFVMPGNHMVQTTTMFTEPGRTLARPGEVYFFMETSSFNGWQYLRDNELILLTNRGERVNLGEASHDGDVASGGGMVQVHETMGYTIPVADLRTLARADTVRGRIGSDEFVMAGDQLQMRVWQRLVQQIDSIPAR